MPKDNLRKPLKKFLKKYKNNCGTDLQGAIRDVMTELAHICAKKQFNIEERFDAAMEVFYEECELRECNLAE